MRKLLNLFIALLLTASAVNAASIDKALSESDINTGAVSISVRDTETGKVLYELNSKKPVNPASTLKILTLTASLDELGKDYEFSTDLYQNKENELFIKLGADPFLKAGDLRKLLNTAKTKNIVEPKAIYIDDTIVDKTEWGEGWQWDDDLNPLMPKFGAYNIDENLLTITVVPTAKGAPAEIKLDVFYPTTFMNLVTTGDSSEIKISRNNNIAPDVLTIEGTVKNQIKQEIPVNHLKRYFRLRLEDAIRAEKIEYYGAFAEKELPSGNISLVETIKHPIEDAVSEIMLNSNNMVAESLFKIAGGHYAQTTGSAQNAVEMLFAYLDKIGLNSSDIKVVDGSGVSKNNLATSDFMTSFLTAQYKISPDYPKMFAPAGEGTLTNRMLYFGDKLRAKTGTLSDVSAITGYITTVKGKVLAFNIMINDAKSKPSEKKMLEEYILRAIQISY